MTSNDWAGRRAVAQLEALFESAPRAARPWGIQAGPRSRNHARAARHGDSVRGGDAEAISLEGTITLRSVEKDAVFLPPKTAS